MRDNEIHSNQIPAFYQGITDFIFLEDSLPKADVIFVPGGNYPDASIRAAQLYQEGYAPFVLPSGRYSVVVGKFVPEKPSSEVWETEWEYLSDILKKHGVPQAAILKEDQATYTYQNAIFSRQLLEQMDKKVKKAIICCQAFHARRCFMYYQEQFPDTELFICPVETKGINKENWYRTEFGIRTVLGEVERCGTQFHEIMNLNRELQEERYGL